LVVEEQRKRLPDIDSNPCLLSDKLRNDLTAQVRGDVSGWQEVVKMPEEVPDKVHQPKAASLRLLTETKNKTADSDWVNGF
jgi:hypothetical protein